MSVMNGESMGLFLGLSMADISGKEAQNFLVRILLSYHFQSFQILYKIALVVISKLASENKKKHKKYNFYD